MYRLGIEQLLLDKKALKHLKAKRVGLLAHPASVDHELRHSLDILKGDYKLNVTCAFGPQHGMRGEKQDNMIESSDFRDSKYGIPVFSLYGEVRKPKKEWLDQLDVLVVDLQDVGCRIYTFLTTLFYIMDDCAKYGKEVWVLDRPNLAGRPIEGNYLKKGFFSFVGGAEIPMRHGLTLGEAGLWYQKKMGLELEYRVVKMKGYDPAKAPGFGQAIIASGPHRGVNEIPWVNPSPNIPMLSTARMYAGTVLIEGTRLSEGRGSTRPLELVASPLINGDDVLAAMTKSAKPILGSASLKSILAEAKLPSILGGAILRSMFFEPTFQKHAKQLCSGIQIHVDYPGYKHNSFKPYRLVCLMLKTIRSLYPDLDLWLPPPYEYEKTNMPIDILSGDSTLRQWVDDSSAKWGDFEKFLAADEKRWLIERKPFLLY